MKKIISVFAVATIVVTTVSLVSCSSDDYNSTLPQFSGITFQPEEIDTCVTVTATAVQYKKGKLLDRTTYTWSISGTTEDLNISNNQSVFYDDDKSNPTCTFTSPSTPGEYTIKFYATYNISGQSKTSGSTVDISGGSVEYSQGPLSGFVTMTKKFKVVAK